MNQFKITRKLNAIGDNCLASFFTHILNDNKIESFFDKKNFHFKNFNCDYFQDTHYIDYEFQYENKKNSNIIQIAIDKFKSKFNIEQEIKITRNYIPVNYKEIETIKQVDVVLVTKSGHWAPVRDWPYFEELKKKLEEKNISFIDVTQRNIKDFEFLDYVKKCKVFVTLETGASHYASQFINKNNSIVIQSGYCDDSFWNYYKYDVIKHDTDCKWCFIQHRECNKGHKCMCEISVDIVLNKILEKIEGYKMLNLI